MTDDAIEAAREELERIAETPYMRVAAFARVLLEDLDDGREWDEPLLVNDPDVSIEDRRTQMSERADKYDLQVYKHYMEMVDNHIERDLDAEWYEDQQTLDAWEPSFGDLLGATEPEPDPEYVYAVEATDLGIVKVGRSKSPENRISSIQTASPSDLDVVAIAEVDDYKDAERRLHDRYADARVRGEWFDLDDEEVADLTDEMDAIGETVEVAV